MGMAILQCYSEQSPQVARKYVGTLRWFKRRWVCALLQSRWSFSRADFDDKVEIKSLYFLGLIIVRNELDTKSHWTA
jgi:hypothetical protein